MKCLNKPDDVFIDIRFHLRGVDPEEAEDFIWDEMAFTPSADAKIVSWENVGVWTAAEMKARAKKGEK